MTSVASSAGTSSPRSSGRLIKLLIVAAIIVVGAAAAALAVGLPSSSSDDPFHGSAVPPLYSDTELAAVDTPLKDAEARAHSAARRWLDAHPAATDEAFSNWAIQRIGPPPGARATRGELAQLHHIAARRTPTGTTAANWLESHGKKQPWKVFRKQDKAFLPQRRYDAVKSGRSPTRSPWAGRCRRPPNGGTTAAPHTRPTRRCTASTRRSSPVRPASRTPRSKI